MNTDPSASPVELVQPQIEQPAPIPDPIIQSSSDSRHMRYAVELFIFAMFGWAWLAIRELIGSMPVMDSVVILSLIISSILNLIASLLFHDVAAFAPFAQGYFNHTLIIWVLYVYSLAESLYLSDSTSLCCLTAQTSVSASPALTYVKAMYGGVLVHQAPAAVTIGFLTLILFLAAAQLQVCIQSPLNWIHSTSALGLSSLIVAHWVAFASSIPLCQQWGGTKIGSIVISCLHWLVMFDIRWLAQIVSFFSKKDKDKNNQQQDEKSQQDTNKKDPVKYWINWAQGFVSLLCVVLGFVMSSLIASMISGGAVTFSLWVMSILLTFCAVKLGVDIYMLVDSYAIDKKEGIQETGQPTAFAGMRFRNDRGHMNIQHPFVPPNPLTQNRSVWFSPYSLRTANPRQRRSD